MQVLTLDRPWETGAQSHGLGNILSVVWHLGKFRLYYRYPK